MQEIPRYVEPAAVEGDPDRSQEILAHMNDHIVLKISDGSKRPGDLLFQMRHVPVNEDMINRLVKRFEAKGWKLHVTMADTARYDLRIYLAHPQKQYRPPQPHDYIERAYPAPSVCARLKSWWESTIG